MPRSLRASVSGAGAIGGASIPDPIFSILGPGSSGLTPTIGTAGTFSRASSITYPTGLYTWATVTAGNPAVGMRAPKRAYHTASTLGGVGIYGPIKNYVLDSTDLTTTDGDWTVIGSGGSADGSAMTTDGEGGTEADLVYGTAINEGIESATAVPAASNSAIFAVQLKGGSGGEAWTIRIVDQAGTPNVIATGNVVLSTNWEQYVVKGRGGAGLTGNMVVQMFTTSGSAACFAWQPQLQTVEYTGTSVNGDIFTSIEMVPIIKTSGTAATLAQSLLYYSGTEFTGASHSALTVCAWFYQPRVNTSDIWENQWIFSLEDSSFVRLAGARLQSTDGKFHSYYGSNTDISITSAPVQNSWNQYCVGVDASGDNETVLNGVSIHDNATTWTARAAARLNVGNQYNSGSTIDNNAWNGIIGQIDVYNVKLTSGQMAEIYETQKSNWYNDPPA